MAGCLRFLRKPINSKKSIYHGEAKNALSIGRLDLNTIFVNHKGQLGQIQPSPSMISFFGKDAVTVNLEFIS